MGYAVLHLEKAKGADGAMSTHIERTIHPKNADRTRTHLNRELVRFPEGVKNRTQAIAHRIETAGTSFNPGPDSRLRKSQFLYRRLWIHFRQRARMELFHRSKI